MNAEKWISIYCNILGFKPALRTHLMEPFFSTSDQSQRLHSQCE
jgi:hypothetical protein